jgi:ribosomal protein S6--L-glutamate ligase
MAFVIAGRMSPTNVALLAAARALDLDAVLLPIDVALRRSRPGDTVLARLDVRPTLDGVEPGFEELDRLLDRGVPVLNPPNGLLAAHDKLQTALRLAANGVPHPRTAHVDETSPLPDLRYPVVVKPRFGSWGRDVTQCATPGELRRCLVAFTRRTWFRCQGALVQELVPPCGYDLRVVVSGGTVIGAIRRVAAPGEWRTNVALGATRAPVRPSLEACRIAVEAAAAVGCDLAGVDLLPGADGLIALEVNGCVDFTDEYAFRGSDVFADALRPLTTERAALAEQNLALV